MSECKCDTMPRHNGFYGFCGHCQADSARQKHDCCARVADVLEVMVRDIGLGSSLADDMRSDMLGEIAKLREPA